MKKRYPNKLHKSSLSQLSPERRQEMNDIKHDVETITVFCDCSVLQDEKVAGLAACIVGDNNFLLRRSKIKVNEATANSYYEMKAVCFALDLLPGLLDVYMSRIRKPHRVVIYTDCNHVDLFLEGRVAPPLKVVSEELQVKVRRFRELRPKQTLEILYMDELRKNNVYYKAAHNACRKAVGRGKA